jgi:DNA-binding response OmpR family regulator
MEQIHPGINLMERQYKLLLIDKDDNFRTTCRDYFAQHGFLVDTAGDGEEGLKKLQTDEADVTLMDLRLPKLDGLDLARYVNEEGINTEVIILTADGDRTDAVAAIKAHVCDWFDKGGLEMSKLLTRVGEVSGMIPPEKIRKLLSLMPKNN